MERRCFYEIRKNARIPVLENERRSPYFSRDAYAFLWSTFYEYSQGGIQAAYFSGKNNGNVPVRNIFQNPELPTGCEITSLTMVLNYLGYSVDKCHLSDTYLSKGEIGWTDFRQSFVGNPRDETSYGCYAPVIAECANRYLKEQESAYRAYDISGVSLDELLRETDAGHPVIIWGTINMLEPYDTMVWEVDGKQIQWRANEHCMVLIGQDAKNIYVNDPLYGKVSYDYNIFKDRYEKMFSQAVVIKSGRAVVG